MNLAANEYDEIQVSKLVLKGAEKIQKELLNLMDTLRTRYYKLMST